MQNKTPTVKDLKKGDIVYECQSGKNAKITCLEDAQDTGEGWQCKVLINNKEMRIYESYDCGAYCLRLYSEPQYINPTKTFNH